MNSDFAIDMDSPVGCPLGNFEGHDGPTGNGEIIPAFIGDVIVPAAAFIAAVTVSSLRRLE